MLLHGFKNQRQKHISSEFCATDTFTFVKDIQDANFRDMFMVSYDVTRLRFQLFPYSNFLYILQHFKMSLSAGFEVQ